MKYANVFDVKSCKNIKNQNHFVFVRYYIMNKYNLPTHTVNYNKNVSKQG